MEWLKDFGVTAYGYVEESIPLSRDHFKNWVSLNNHLPLTYLEGERLDKRLDLKNYWNEFESSLVFLFSYHKSHHDLRNFYRENPNWNGLKIASYTLGFDGLDYHDVLRTRLTEIGEKLKIDHNLNYKITLDTHPVLERDLAHRAGLGWFGKNSMLIHRSEGSFVMIGSLLLDKKLNLPSSPLETDHCGQCTLCVDLCPTSAIDPLTRTVVAQDCISTFTIEQFKLETVPSEKMDLTSGFIFGCDICQDVCPWNKRIDRINERLTSPELKSEKINELLSFFLLKPAREVHDHLLKMSQGEVRKFFAGTSFERSGKRGLLKNLVLYLKQKLN